MRADCLVPPVLLGRSTFSACGTPAAQPAVDGPDKRPGADCGDVEEWLPNEGDFGGTNSPRLPANGLAVLREACRRLSSSDLSGCTLYGTAEPCPMCSTLILIIWRSWTALSRAGSRRGAGLVLIMHG
jgi:hypothetical protein